MNLKTSKKDNKLLLILLLSFAVPLLLACAALALNKIAPFGDKAFLFWDAKLQYKDYYGYLWDVLHGNASLEYSASKSLGGQTIGLVTYYLTCPLNLLVYFIGKSQIPLFICATTILKIAFSGLTASYFLRKRHGAPVSACVVLSACYALMEYSVVYGRNIMWLDGVVLLPLACLGVYELLYNNKKGLLFFSVAIAIISNWYSGFMVCLMTGFYFLYELALKYDFVKSFKQVIGKMLADAVRVAADMILGVLASGAVLIPACLSLVGGKAKFRLIYASINVGILECFKGFDINAGSNSSDWPLLYCGAVMLILVVYLFLDKRIDLKKRIASLVLFSFLILSFCFKELDIMWTAFVQSHSYAYRWAFVFGFVMLALAGTAVSEIKAKKLNSKALFSALGIIFGVFLLLDYNKNFKSRFLAYAYMIAIAIYVVCIFVTGCVKKSRAKQIICLSLVALLTFAELGYNMYDAFKVYDESEKQYVEYTNETENIVNEIKQKDTSFYRLEKQISYLTEVDRDVANSESLMFNYNGFENYTSTYDANVDEFMARMGYSDSTYIPDEASNEAVLNPTDVYWNCPMLVSDSLLGLKYQLNNKEYPGLEAQAVESKLPEGYTLYNNPYALPLAYCVSQNAQSIEWGVNPFDNQEQLLNACAGYETDIYKDLSAEYKGLKSNSEKYTVTAEYDGPMYFYTDASSEHKTQNEKNCDLYVNGEKVQPICKRFQFNAVYIGTYSKGETVNIEIKHISKEKVEHNIYLAQLDMSAFASAVESISSRGETNLNISGNEVSGQFTANEASTVMLTLPYTEGWSVYVDGEKVEYKELADTFIGIDLTAGTHEIYMKYSTLHKNAGVGATVLGVAGFAGWCIAEALIKKKKSK